ncbi:MAG: glycoside hydrolase family 13 protein [Saccharofermentanales bacterium]
MNGQGFDFAAVHHTPDSVYAYPVDSSTLRLRLKTAKGDCTAACVRFKNIYDHTNTPSRQEMVQISSDRYNDYYEAEISEPGKRFKYFFELTGHAGDVWDFSYNGFTPHDASYNEFFFYPYLFEEDVPDSPAWAREGFIYQIFIDRFNNGDRSNDPADCQDWNCMPASRSFYGGDFKGITDKIEYIAALGATILYVNPIFLSDSNHKYDAIDYYRIDPTFGTVEEACALVQRAHALGIRVILDAVFNHCSNKNALFLDVIEKGDASEYYSWFTVNGPKVETAPHNYDTFAGLVPKMPRLNSSHPLVQDYCIDAAVFWTRLLDIDGWRLDVADEVSHVFWRKFRSRLRSVKPDIYILGEVWNRATPWLQGDEFDSVTNYKFRNALLALACSESRSSTDFWDEVCRNEMNYRSTALPFMVNLVSSHDVKRILTELHGNRRCTRPIFGILLTYLGIPLLYYGDEIGIEGGEDPDNRRTMKWDTEDQDTALLDFIRRLGNLRKSSDVLRHGNVMPFRSLPPRMIGFVRSQDRSINNLNPDPTASGDLLMLANFSHEEGAAVIDGPSGFTESPAILSSLLDERSFTASPDGKFRIMLPGYDFIILTKANIL